MITKKLSVSIMSQLSHGGSMVRVRWRSAKNGVVIKFEVWKELRKKKNHVAGIVMLLCYL